ncbi:MAG: hypothetical protein KAW02_02030 [candidate division Zixibacteria bacterium]|nr:hypothetical protein [candidate division Zixibacteria bacterium]
MHFRFQRSWLWSDWKDSQTITLENEDQIYHQMRSKLLNLLRKSLRPEFLNRIDEMIEFRSLSFEDIKDIVDLQLREVDQRLAEQEDSVY